MQLSLGYSDAEAEDMLNAPPNYAPEELDETKEQMLNIA